MQRRRWAAAAVALLLLAAACAVDPSATPAEPPATSTAPAPPPAATASIPDIVERLTPSVVTVNTTLGSGSGVVYRPDIILTNAHVVGDADQVTVGFADGTTSPAEVVASDSVTDLAIVRTARTGLPVPRYCTDPPRPGDTVLAIGSPLGFEGTVTAGIVSGLNRQIPGSAAQSRALVDLIQTDAAISPGNSGGALLDATGCVIGINEAYIPPASGAVSIGFAIPAATAVDIADQLLADGTATHPWLGVSLRPLTPEIRRALGVPAERGVLVLEVEPGSPAATAGVRQSDVIVGLAGEPVDSLEDLIAALRDVEPGQQTRLTIVRAGGERVELPISVGSVTG